MKRVTGSRRLHRQALAVFAIRIIRHRSQRWSAAACMPSPARSRSRVTACCSSTSCPKFQRPTLEALRQPIESRRAVVARANHHVTYPARFMLVAAMNPCRCGHLADPALGCGRAPKCSREYRRGSRGRCSTASGACTSPRRSPIGASPHRDRDPELATTDSDPNCSIIVSLIVFLVGPAMKRGLREGASSTF